MITTYSLSQILRTCAKNKINLPRLKILIELKQAKEAGSDYLTCTKLSKLVGLHIPGATSACDGLEERQLIARTRGVEDRREIQVRLTDSGEKLLDEILGTPVPTLGLRLNR